MKIKNEEKRKIILNSRKYFMFGVFIFVLFFVSISIVHSTGISTKLTTLEATNVTDKEAKLWGQLNPNGLAYAYFRYSPLEKPPVFCNDIYGSRMRATDEIRVDGNTIKKVGLDIAGLLPKTNYYYCIVGSNDSGIAYGKVKSFQTQTTSLSSENTNTIYDSVSIVTKNALVVDTVSAYLNGFYSAIMPTETYFSLKKDGEDWQNKKFGLQQHSAGAGGDISYLLKGLSPSTVYYFRAAIRSKVSGETLYGGISTFTTKSSGTIGQGVEIITGNGANGNSIWDSASGTWTTGTGTNGADAGIGIGMNMETVNPGNLVLGQIATPPWDATVHYREGIETVFTRQIMANTELAKVYGYQDGENLQTFAWNLSDLFARIFGYVNSRGKEIRVSTPDVAAYQLYLNNGILTVYEYYNFKVVNIQKMTTVLRNKYGYEYYFNK